MNSSLRQCRLFSRAAQHDHTHRGHSVRGFATTVCLSLCGFAHAQNSPAPTASSPLERGQKAQLVGHWNLAIEEFSGLLKQQPQNVGALVGLGFSHFKLGELDKADEWYRRALKLNSRHVGAGYGLGQIAIERKNWSEAVTWFSEITRIAPQFEPVRTRHNWALALRALKRTSEANAIYAQALTQPSENLYPQLWRDAIDNSIAQADFPTSLDWSQRATELFPDNAWLWDKMGWSWTQIGRQRRANEAYQRAALLAYPDSKPKHKTLLSLPFRGAWRVVQGNSSFGTHQGLGARFAWDFVALKGEKSSPENRPRNGTTNDDFGSFGQEILAPAEGRVVELGDGTPDNAPHHRDPSPHSGNYIVIEHAPGEWSVLGHLQNGSVEVKVGQLVTRGQRIARCGNSGYSGQPHLHFSFLGLFQNQRISQPAHFSKFLVGENKSLVESGAPTENSSVENQVLKPGETEIVEVKTD